MPEVTIPVGKKNGGPEAAIEDTAKTAFTAWN
jgi:hypothetical protein